MIITVWRERNCGVHHILVPAESAEAAMAGLRALQQPGFAEDCRSPAGFSAPYARFNPLPEGNQPGRADLLCKLMNKEYKSSSIGWRPTGMGAWNFGPGGTARADHLRVATRRPHGAAIRVSLERLLGSVTRAPEAGRIGPAPGPRP